MTSSKEAEGDVRRMDTIKTSTKGAVLVAEIDAPPMRNQARSTAAASS